MNNFIDKDFINSNGFFKMNGGYRKTKKRINLGRTLQKNNFCTILIIQKNPLMFTLIKILLTLYTLNTLP